MQKHDEKREQRKRDDNRSESGFTLIELMIVIIIIGLIAGIVTPNVIKRLDKAKQSTAQAQIESLSQALDAFRLDMGRYPTSQEGLQALREKPTTNAEKWDGPYIKKELPADPWGAQYQYKAPGAHGDFDIISYGGDGKEGGDNLDQDIVSWKGIDAK